MKARTLAEIDHEAAATATVPRLIAAQEMAGLLGVTTRTLRRLVHVGEFPKPVMVGRRPRWAASDYAAYLRARQAKRVR